MLKFRNKLLAAKALFKARMFGRKLPLAVSWNLTNRCNQGCIYCNIRNVDSKEMDIGQILSVLDELTTMGTRWISFTGGEPLLRDDIGLIVNYALERNIVVTINTNGILLKSKIAEIKKVSKIQLSFDGPEQIHDYLRGKGSYNKVEEAIQIAKKNNLSFIFCTVLSKLNLNHIDYILNIASLLGVKVVFQPATRLLLEGKNVNPTAPPEKEYKEAINRLISEKRMGNKCIYNSIAGLTRLSNWPRSVKIRCSAGLLYCRIEPNGDVYACETNPYAKPLNCLSYGFKGAFKRLCSVQSCGYCWCGKCVELNLISSFNLDAIFNIIDMEKDIPEFNNEVIP